MEKQISLRNLNRATLGNCQFYFNEIMQIFVQNIPKKQLYIGNKSYLIVKLMKTQAMVAHFTMSAYGVNQTFRSVEGIRLHQKSRLIRKNKSEKTYFSSYVRSIF